jgi:glycosyltransferase involved in cell wall biosynthesis
VKGATVLHVIATLNIGGAEKQLALLLGGLDRTRFRPILACTTQAGPLLGPVADGGVEVRVFHKRGRVDPRLVADLRRFMRERRPDIVHTWMFTANTWGRVAALLARVPALVASERCVDLWKGPLHRGLDRLLAVPTRRVIANSRAVARFLIEGEGIPASRLRVVTNGLDPRDAERLRPRAPQEVAALRRALGIEPGALVVGDVSRLDPKNGLLCWAAVIGRLAERHPSLVAVHAGGAVLEIERRYAKRLDEEIARRGLGGRVRMLGVRRDLEAVLPALDLFLHTSTMEGFPNCVMEAMAASLPVVATRAGGTPELVAEGETGCLADVDEADGLAARASALLDDPLLRRRLGEAGARRVREICSLRRMIEETERVYDEVLEEARSAGGRRREGGRS